MAEAAKYLDKALDLLLRLPPQFISKSLDSVIKLRPELQEDLLSAVDMPLKAEYDLFQGKYFLTSTYNQDGDSHRSPWSNEYFPFLSDGLKPSVYLRELEVAANKAFEVYTEMYYESANSSVYMWDLEDGFATAVLIQKAGDSSQYIKGTWDSIHVIQVTRRKTYITYKITSTITLWLHTKRDASGLMNISGSISRQNQKTCQTCSLKNYHVVNIGELVEEMENSMRHTLQEIYFWKTKDVTTRHLRYCVKSEADQRRLSRMVDFKIERSRSAVHRSNSGKHLLVPMQNSFKV